MKRRYFVLAVVIVALFQGIMVTRNVQAEESYTDEQGVIYTLNSDGTCFASGAAESIGESLVIPGSILVSGTEYKVTEIGKNAFEGRLAIKSVELSEGVECIRYGAFVSCISLVSVDMPSTLQTIEEQVFDTCESLENIRLPENLTYLGGMAFSRCYNLKSVYISASVSEIGGAVFERCSSLESVEIDAENPYYSSDETGYIYNKEKTILILALPKTETAEIPETVTEIGEGAFQGCVNLTSVIVPGTVRKIDVRLTQP